MIFTKVFIRLTTVNVKKLYNDDTELPYLPSVTTLYFASQRQSASKSTLKFCMSIHNNITKLTILSTNFKPLSTTYSAQQL